MVVAPPPPRPLAWVTSDLLGKYSALFFRINFIVLHNKTEMYKIYLHLMYSCIFYIMDSQTGLCYFFSSPGEWTQFTEPPLVISSKLTSLQKPICHTLPRHPRVSLV